MRQHVMPKFLKTIIMQLLPRYRARYCPLCGSYAPAFLPFGTVPRPDAQCPTCGSLERHRLAWLFFQQRTNIFQRTPKSMLHIAPERQLEKRFKQLAHLDYLTADLFNPTVMVKMDITDVQYPDNTFDIIYCSHVLEHVSDDRKAMRELHRVLKLDGWAVIMVPITAEKSFEDPSIMDPSARERVFGQHDHVRRYGPDFEERLAEAGFKVEPIVPTEIVPLKEIRRLAIREGQAPLFLCTKIS